MAVAALPSIAKQKLAGAALTKKVPVTLGKDLGFGKRYRLSMAGNFKPWGAQQVAKEDGFPVRLGKYSIRFETREGVCGWERGGWSDCRNGRSRHELSTAIYGFDPWHRERWYALSLFFPKDFKAPKQMGTSVFQFLAGGKPNWMFKFQTFEGLFVQREFKFERTYLVATQNTLDAWNDFVIRIKHSPGRDGVLTVWVNGRRMFDYKGKTARAKQSRKRPYFKFGIYNTALGANGRPVGRKSHRNGKGMPNHVLYFDEVRFGATCKALKLSDLGYDCSKLIKP